MKKIIFTFLLAILSWLTYMNIFSWGIKILNAAILVKLLSSVLALVLSFIVQQLMIKTAGSMIMKDSVEEIADVGSAYMQTTKTVLILFIIYCLFKMESYTLLWIYASTAVLDNYIYSMWQIFLEKMNKV